MGRIFEFFERGACRSEECGPPVVLGVVDDPLPNITHQGISVATEVVQRTLRIVVGAV